ncbi:hypothetical protein FJY90_06165 [Candidatus Gottesmanbacteria bacterium]|nr:hypothetical protein [Candidatus Gottesmanbacteria bacterium]
MRIYLNPAEEGKRYQVRYATSWIDTAFLELTLVTKGSDAGWRIEQRTVRQEGRSLVFTREWPVVRQGVDRRAQLPLEGEIKAVLLDVRKQLDFPKKLSDALDEWLKH